MGVERLKAVKAQFERDPAGLAVDNAWMRAAAAVPSTTSVPLRDYEAHVGAAGAAVVKLKQDAEAAATEQERLRKELARTRALLDDSGRAAAQQQQRWTLAAEGIQAAYDAARSLPHHGAWAPVATVGPAGVGLRLLSS